MQKITIFRKKGTPFWKTCWRVDWPVGEVDDLQPGAHGLHRALHGHDAPGALGRHVQVVRDGAGRHLQHLQNKKTCILSLFLQQNGRGKTGWDRDCIKGSGSAPDSLIPDLEQAF